MKVALYARVSTEKQEEEKTIESQIAELVNYAQEKEYVIIDRYIDNGYSGTLLARPELDRLRDDAPKGLFEAVIIHSPDRLARRYVWQEVVIEELKTKGIQTIFKNRPIAETPEDQLLLGMQGIVAEYERTKFVERTRRGRLHRAKSGHILGNIPPYGLLCVKKSESETGYAYYKINEEEAKNARLMFSLLVQKQMTTYGIIVELNRLGIKARKGGRWSKSSVAKILRNETYTGVTYYNKHYGVPSQNNGSNGEVKYHRRKNTTLRLRPKEEWIAIPGVPQIIDPETFLNAQKQLETNSRFSNRNTKLHYLLRGLPRCNKDNRSYTGVPMHGKPFYRCSGKSKLISEVGCKSPSISARILEPIVWDSVVEFVNNPKIIIDQLMKRQQKRAIKGSNTDVEIAQTETALRGLKTQEDRLIKAYSAGALRLEQLKDQNPTIQKERERLNSAKEKLLALKSNKQLDHKGIKNVKIYLDNFKKALQRFDFEKRQKFLRTLLSEIIINERQLLIRGELPIRANFDLCPQPIEVVDSIDTIGFEIEKKLPKVINQHKWIYI